jgi:signal transduction protein with GAF and PtsI domain
MSSSLDIQEAIEKIINETCKTLECDRASVFLIDHKRQELWTKVAKGAKTIRIPLGGGIAGHVAKSG